MFLIDTNIWLERMLVQEQSQAVGEFLDRTPQEHLCITDFSFHSIGVYPDPAETATCPGAICQGHLDRWWGSVGPLGTGGHS